MSTYPIPDLLNQWQRDELTAEQAIGHLLQHLAALVQRQAETEQRLRQLEQPVVQPKS